MIDRGEKLDYVEWLAAFFGVLGCAIVAVNLSWSKFGWIPYALSEALLMWWGYKRKAWGLFIMQTGYLIVSMVAVYRWFG